MAAQTKSNWPGKLNRIPLQGVVSCLTYFYSRSIWDHCPSAHASAKHFFVGMWGLLGKGCFVTFCTGYCLIPEKVSNKLISPVSPFWCWVRLGWTHYISYSLASWSEWFHCSANYSILIDLSSLIWMITWMFRCVYWECPISRWILSPEVDRSEFPVFKSTTCYIPVATGKKIGSCSWRTC